MGCNCGGKRGTGQTASKGYSFIPPQRQVTDATTGETTVIQPATITPLGTIIEARALQRQYGGGRIKSIK